MIFSIIKDSNVLEELLIEHFLELERNVEINFRNGFIHPTLNCFPTQPSNQTQTKIWVNESSASIFWVEFMSNITEMVPKAHKDITQLFHFK